ncbi:MAG: FAD-dependent oxidoreductase [Nitrososphaerales archaeon]
MTEESFKDKKLSRRQFMGTAAAGAAALGVVAGATTMLPHVAATPAGAKALAEVEGHKAGSPVALKAQPFLVPTAVPSTWDYTADVVVVGMGFAGLTTAITANDLGANVLLLEKADASNAGGNSRVCGQCIWVPGTDQNGNANASAPLLYNEQVYFEQMADGQGFPTDDTLIQTLVLNSAQNKTWFEGLGATMQWGAFPQPFYPQFMGASAVSMPYGGSWSVKTTQPYGGNWFFLQQQLQNRNINVMYSTPAVGLIQSPTTGEILGVMANPAGSDTIAVKANKGVVLCSGGYEYNDQMVRDYIGVPNQLFFGSPYNTGDGVAMAQAVGANLWHMDVAAAPSGYAIKTPQYKANIPINIPSKGGYIMVGADSKRFSNETQSPGYNTAPSPGTTIALVAGKYLQNGAYKSGYFPQPMHLVFDSVAFGAGALFQGSGGTGMGWASAAEGYKADPTNKTELGYGWVTQASTVAALATAIGADSTALPAEVTNWNTMVAAGTDTEFGRTTGLTAISTPPYYAILLKPLLYNTQGGPVRNSKAQVIDTHGNPIPRLYSAGELGEVFSFLYQCCRNVSACHTMGRIAAQNVTSLMSQ